MKSELQRAAEHWSKKEKPPAEVRPRWWQHRAICRHINRRVCGTDIDGAGAGLRRWVSSRITGLPLASGVSIGCGNAVKEINLIKAGIVDRFDLFEIAEERVKQGTLNAQQAGLEGRIQYHSHSPFAEAAEERYDLVYWDNSLHHMLDVREALQYSRDVLKPGGYLVMDDFVGPSRFQWTDRNLEIATQVRQSLPARFLKGWRSEEVIPAEVRRPSAEKLIADDPTEAADSDRIIPELQRIFPEVELKLTGGAVYHLALNDVLANFTDDDLPLMKLLLLVDDMASDLGENHYAAAIAQKPSSSVAARDRDQDQSV